MNSNRKTAIIVGLLFITATVTALLSLSFIGPILDTPDYLIKVSANVNQMLIGVLFELILAGAVAGIAVFMFPILKKHNEALALGYVGARIFEGLIIIVGSISYLSLLTLSQEYVVGTPDAFHFQTLGTLLLAVHDWSFLLGGGAFVFCVTALILNYLLYQSKLVPRFISVWGLIGAVLMLVSGLLSMFDLNPSPTTTSTISILTYLFLPIAVNEMFLAVWLIVKGFNPSAIASGSAKTDINEEK